MTGCSLFKWPPSSPRWIIQHPDEPNRDSECVGCYSSLRRELHNETPWRRHKASLRRNRAAWSFSSLLSNIFRRELLHLVLHMYIILTTSSHLTAVWICLNLNSCFPLTAADTLFQNERTGLFSQSVHPGQMVVNVSRTQTYLLRFSFWHFHIG